ncbi:MAG: T9SS type A sorting domain-containing protein [Bacteroidales bacterium]|nr:T9SS type A sorting domain-containing protein [Bacteroidales bacterium]
MNRISKIVLPALMILFFGISSRAAELNFSVNRISAPDALSYKWYYNGIELDGVVGQEIYIMGVGVYQVTMKYENGEEKIAATTVPPKSTSPRKIYIIGDSTASYYDSNSYPRTGWAMTLQPFFNQDSVLIVNKALSGRSSKSYLTDASGWPTVYPALREGDFLFIQFAHNDEKSDDPTRYTEPYTTFKEYLSIYIDTARSRGAYPVLLTPIHRNSSWTGDQINNTHGDYPDAMRQLASEKNVPLIDLTAKTEILLERMGKVYSTDSVFNNLPENTWINYPEGNEDNTHLQENGAFQVCKLVMEGIAELDTNPSIGLIVPCARAATIIRVGVSPAMIGKITGAGVFPVGQQVTLKGTAVNASKGLVVSAWTHNGDTISRSKDYSFILDSTCPFLTAIFDTGYLVNVTTNISKTATIYGSGRYASGSPATIIAAAKAGFEFVCWTEGEDTISLDTALSFVMEPQERNVVANLKSLVDVKNISISEKIRVFPNPSHSIINISSPINITRVQLFDIAGHLLYDNQIGTNETIINSANQEAGIYIISIYTEQGIIQKKVQIVH